MTTFEILARAAGFVIVFIGGIVFHAWVNRQKSPTLTLDAIKAASALLAEAAKSTEDAVTIANERKQAVDLALSQAAARFPTVK